MGVSYSVIASGWDGNVHRRVTLQATFDTSYTNGGEALAAGDAGLGSIDTATVASGITPSGYAVRYDDASGVLRVFEENAAAGPLAEVADATDLSGETVTLQVLGRS